jgi:hypothetical protein
VNPPGLPHGDVDRDLRDHPVAAGRDRVRLEAVELERAVRLEEAACLIASVPFQQQGTPARCAVVSSGQAKDDAPRRQSAAAAREQA